MKIIEIIADNEVSAKNKLKAIKSLVKEVRATYGNEDADIPSPKISTVNGNVDINLLTTDEKVAVAEGEIRRCISQASAVTENVEGSLFDRAFEFAVAVNPVLVNLNKKSTSKY
jgi:hypothetical protein